MTASDSERLAELIERKFFEVDARFGRMDTRFEAVQEQTGEIHRHFDVVAESLRSEIRQVAEGVLSVDEKIERFRQEVRGEFREVRAMIKFSYAELDRRVSALEDALLSLRGRVERLEARYS